MKEIKIQVRNKIASLVNKDEILVCGNNDYLVNFDFDEEWDSSIVKTALFVFNEESVAIPFEGNSLNGAAIENSEICAIGCFSGDLKTTTPAFVKCLRSVRDIGSVPKPPSPDVYDQIMELLNKYIQGGGGSGESGFSPIIEVSAIDGGHRLTITDVNGTKTVDVMDGETGEKGDKYVLTEADKSEIAQEVIESLPVAEGVGF